MKNHDNVAWKKQRELLYQTFATTGPGLTPLFILCWFG